MTNWPRLYVLLNLFSGHRNKCSFGVDEYYACWPEGLYNTTIRMPCNSIYFKEEEGVLNVKYVTYTSENFGTYKEGEGGPRNSFELSSFMRRC